MREKVVFTLLEYKVYLAFIFATLLSGIGNGFIQVLVYNQIALNKFPPLYFGIAFSLSVFPALIGSHAGRFIAESNNSRSYLALSQLFSLSMIYMIFNISFKTNTKYILLCEAITCFSSSVAFPVLQKLVKVTFKHEKLGLAAKFDTYIFGANIILGLGFGAILISLINVKQLLVISCALYVCSACIYLCFTPKKKVAQNSDSKKTSMRWGSLSYKQKLSFVLMPTLIIIGTPATSLLPSIYFKFNSNELSTYFMISPVLLILIFRSIGQFLGPLLIKTEKYANFSQNNKIIYAALLIFITAYISIFTTYNFHLTLLLIVLAHTASNVIFSLAIYLTLASFKTEDISKVTAIQFQLNQVVISLTAILSGAMANYIGGRLTIVIFSTFGLLLFALLRPHNEELNKVSYA